MLTPHSSLLTPHSSFLTPRSSFPALYPQNTPRESPPLAANNDDEWVDPWEITNGVKGYNSRALHVVYVGGLDKEGKPKDTRTAAQKAALRSYVEVVRLRCPEIRVVGHNELAAKACPCFDVAELRGAHQASGRGD